MQQGEPLFNLTLFLLEGNELPDVEYGENPDHKYQNTKGIVMSQRKLPADISKEQMVSSSFLKLDPKIQLREAGHPFSYIGTELTQLQGRFELVSGGVEALKEKIDETKQSLLDKMDTMFQMKFLWAASLCIGVISGSYAVRGFLIQKTVLTAAETYVVAGCIGIVLSGLGVRLLFLPKKPGKKH